MVKMILEFARFTEVNSKDTVRLNLLSIKKDEIVGDRMNIYVSLSLCCFFYGHVRIRRGSCFLFTGISIIVS
jgi:hypothetical protein